MLRSPVRLLGRARSASAAAALLLLTPLPVGKSATISAAVASSATDSEGDGPEPRRLKSVSAMPTGARGELVALPLGFLRNLLSAATREDSRMPGWYASAPDASDIRALWVGDSGIRGDGDILESENLTLRGGEDGSPPDMSGDACMLLLPPPPAPSSGDGCMPPPPPPISGDGCMDAAASPPWAP